MKIYPESHQRIKDLPKIERPREKLISKGPQNLKYRDKIELCRIL